MPVAGAIFMALVVFVIPTNTGKPFKGLGTTAPLQRLIPFYEPGENSLGVDLDSGDSPLGESTPSDGDLTPTVHERGSQNEVDIEAEPDEPSVVVSMVPCDKLDDDCEECCFCQQKISSGTCALKWQLNETRPPSTVHSACAASFAISNLVATDMLHALVRHQPFVEKKLAGLISLVVNELLDMTRHDFEEFLPLSMPVTRREVVDQPTAASNHVPAPELALADTQVDDSQIVSAGAGS